jgi:hypothetical protein
MLLGFEPRAADQVPILLRMREGRLALEKALQASQREAQAALDLQNRQALRAAADGATVAVGAIDEDTSASGINPTPNNNAGGAGAVYVFAPPVSVAYCTAGTSTNGCVPSISSTGTPSSAATSGFFIDVANVEGQKQGIVFYGVDNFGFTCAFTVQQRSRDSTGNCHRSDRVSVSRPGLGVDSIHEFWRSVRHRET